MKFCEMEHFLKANKISTRKFFGNTFINIGIERTSTISKYLTEEELDKPIIRFLSDNDFNRGCWMYNNENVIVKNTFNDYGTLNPYVGFVSHQKCEQKNCDLILYEHSCAGTTKILDRFDDYEINFLNLNLINMWISLRLPIICNKQIIIETFLKSYEDKCLLLSDLDLYFYQMINNEKDINMIDYHVSIVKNKCDFVLNTCSENNSHNLDMDSQHIMYGYCIMCKNILFFEFKNYFPFFSDCLSKIIHEYVNFESMVPEPNIFIDESRIRKYFNFDDQETFRTQSVKQKF